MFSVVGKDSVDVDWYGTPPSTVSKKRKEAGSPLKGSVETHYDEDTQL